MIVDPDFCDHWKTRMLVGLLSGDEAAPIYVLRIWAHCQNRRQCIFENFPAAALKALCRYQGDAAEFEAALITAGWVERLESSILVTGWGEYNAKLIAAWTNGGAGQKKERKPDSFKLADPQMTSTTWNRLRAKIIDRDGLVCQYCQAELESCVIDHIIPVSRGGDNSEENLTVCCRECNTSKQDRTLNEWDPPNPTPQVTGAHAGAVGGGTGVLIGEERRREDSIGEDKNISSRKDRSADRGRSFQSTGNFSKREEAEASPDEPKLQLDLSHVDWGEVVGLAQAVAKSVAPLTQADRRAWLKYAVMATTCCSEFWLSNAALGAVSKHQRGGVKKTKIALFVGALKKNALDNHDVAEADFDAIFRAIEIPLKVWKSDCLPIGEPVKRKHREDDE